MTAFTVAAVVLAVGLLLNWAGVPLVDRITTRLFPHHTTDHEPPKEPTDFFARRDDETR